MTTTAITTCPKCGTANQPGARFCFKCGAVLAAAAPSAAPVTTPPLAPAQPALVTLQCPTCGAKLQLGPEIDRFACMHCGNEHIVRRGSGYISIEPVMQELRQVNSNLGQVKAADQAIAQHVAGTSQAVVAAQENANRMAQRAMLIQQVSMLEKQLEGKKLDLKQMNDRGPLYGWVIFFTSGVMGLIANFVLSKGDEIRLIFLIICGMGAFCGFIYALITTAMGTGKKKDIDRTKQEIAIFEMQLTNLRAQLNQ